MNQMKDENGNDIWIYEWIARSFYLQISKSQLLKTCMLQHPIGGFVTSNEILTIQYSHAMFCKEVYPISFREF